MPYRNTPQGKNGATPTGLEHGNSGIPAPARLFPAIPTSPWGVPPSALRTRPPTYYGPSTLFLPKLTTVYSCSMTPAATCTGKATLVQAGLPLFHGTSLGWETSATSPSDCSCTQHPLHGARVGDNGSFGPIHCMLGSWVFKK